jgi:DNA/RNA-binding domain of Phe-tRNA-synthetase-like protein
MTFQYHPDIVERFPEVVGGVIVADGLQNGPSSQELQAEYETEQKSVNARIGGKPLSEIESLAAWRTAFRRFGVDPTQYRSACEALLRRLTKQGNIPSINTLVDIGNLISIRYGLPVAVFDTRAVQGAISVRFADGSESFTPLGETAPEHPEPGEVIFADDRQLVVARRWCWRQSDESASRETTTNVVVTVEAHHASGHADVQSALDDLVKLLEKYARGSVKKRSILDATHPTLSDQ